MMTARLWPCQFLRGTAKSIAVSTEKNFVNWALKRPFRDFCKGAKLLGNKVRLRLLFSSRFAACGFK